MPTVQSSYSENIAQATVGQIANAVNCDVDTYEAEGSDGIPFGRAVKRGTGDDQCELGVDVDATSHAVTNFLGVSVKDPTRDPRDADKYKAGANVNVMWRGDIWVQVNSAVKKGGPVVAKDDDGELGSVNADDDNGTVVGGAVWLSDAADNGLALLRLTGNEQKIATA